jgi:hypothetical protein
MCGVGPDDECAADCPSRYQQLPPPVTLHVTNAEISRWLDARDLTPDARAAVLAVINELRGHTRPNVEFLTVWDWINYGVDRKWVTGACATHDGIPSTPEEDTAWEEGSDPCQPILRVWMN